MVKRVLHIRSAGKNREAMKEKYLTEEEIEALPLIGPLYLRTGPETLISWLVKHLIERYQLITFEEFQDVPGGMILTRGVWTTTVQRKDYSIVVMGTPVDGDAATQLAWLTIQDVSQPGDLCVELEGDYSREGLSEVFDRLQVEILQEWSVGRPRTRRHGGCLTLEEKHQVVSEWLAYKKQRGRKRRPIYDSHKVVLSMGDALSPIEEFCEQVSVGPYAGLSPSTLKKYIRELKDMGLYDPQTQTLRPIDP
jgi:hypothetical protein